MFPTEVECDFAHWYPNEDLGAWHRGELDHGGRLVLSSRRMVVLMAGLPPTSAYKTSMRGGYLTESELVRYETYNELAKLRASYYAMNGGEDSLYEPHTFVDPIVRVEKAMEEEQRSEDTIDASENLYGDMGL